MEENESAVAPDPFTAPSSAIQASADEGVIKHYGMASAGQRILNLFVDFVGYLMWSMLLGVFIGIFAPGLLAEDGLFMQVFGWIVMLSYYCLLEFFTGRTLGKVITGTRVVRRVDSRRPTFLQILGRSAARFVPFEVFSCLGTPPDGWHDRWSGTYVVRMRPTKMDLAAMND